LQVFVNEHEVAPDIYGSTREKISFDRELGRFAAGDTIYVSWGRMKRITMTHSQSISRLAGFNPGAASPQHAL
jgi:hypothetical protein